MNEDVFPGELWVGYQRDLRWEDLGPEATQTWVAAALNSCTREQVCGVAQPGPGGEVQVPFRSPYTDGTCPQCAVTKILHAEGLSREHC